MPGGSRLTQSPPSRPTTAASLTMTGGTARAAGESEMRLLLRQGKSLEERGVGQTHLYTMQEVQG